MTEKMKLLCKRAINVQDACNLSGVIASFEMSMQGVREMHPEKGTDFYNTHPIAVLYSSKIASLTNSETPSCFASAYDFCKENS